MCVYKQNRLDLRNLFLMSEVSKVVFVAVYRVMLLMLEVSKVNCFTYYVLHCMSKRSKGMSNMSKVVFAAVYRVVLLMPKVSKVNSFIY